MLSGLFDNKKLGLLNDICNDGLRRRKNGEETPHGHTEEDEALLNGSEGRHFFFMHEVPHIRTYYLNKVRGRISEIPVFFK